MKIEKTELQDAFIITPDVFGDSRGWFMETYSKIKLCLKLKDNLLSYLDNFLSVVSTTTEAYSVGRFKLTAFRAIYQRRSFKFPNV